MLAAVIVLLLRNGWRCSNSTRYVRIIQYELFAHLGQVPVRKEQSSSKEPVRFPARYSLHSRNDILRDERRPERLDQFFVVHLSVSLSVTLSLHPSHTVRHQKDLEGSSRPVRHDPIIQSGRNTMEKK